MTVSNIKYYNNLEFENYLAMDGVSYSSTKENIFTPSEGSMLGTRTHNYLLEPEKYDWIDADKVKPMAAAIRKYLGDSLQYLQKEVAFTAEFEHNGLTMLYKGRFDLGLPGTLIVDLKIMAADLAPAVKYFGYDKQLSGYCYGTNTPLALIISFNKKKKIIETQIIKPCEQFWEYQVSSRGDVKF